MNEEEDFRQRLSAILAADAVGYSRLMEKDERATMAALEKARAIFRTEVESHHGRIVNMPGDSVLAAFDAAAGAVSAAISVQRKLAEMNTEASPDVRLRFRIGVHLGDVIENPDGDIHGDGVNI